MWSIFPSWKLRPRKKRLLGLPCRRQCTPHFRLMPLEGEHLFLYCLSPAFQTVKSLNLLKRFHSRHRPLALLLCASRPFCSQTFLSWGLLSIGFQGLCFLACPSYLPVFLPPPISFSSPITSQNEGIRYSPAKCLERVANLGRRSFPFMLLCSACAQSEEKEFLLILYITWNCNYLFFN